MRIAVIADTHGRFPASAAGELRKADEIWHLGDYCDQQTLDAVKALGRPFYGILGNNDWGLTLPPQLVLERAGVAQSGRENRKGLVDRRARMKRRRFPDGFSHNSKTTERFRLGGE
jgi:hypothetical protein